MENLTKQKEKMEKTAKARVKSNLVISSQNPKKDAKIGNNAPGSREC